MNILAAEHLRKAYTAERILLEDASFSLQEGEKVGVIGVNGMGKSTLLRIIAGKDTPETGTVIFRNDITVGILEQEPLLEAENTIFEEVFHTETPVLQLIKAYENAITHNDIVTLEKLIPEMDLHSAWDYETVIKQILSKLKIDTYEKKYGHSPEARKNGSD